MRFFKETNIQFVKFSKTAITISSVCLLIGLVSIFLINGFNLGIDFTGGTLVQVQFDRETTTGEIRGALTSVNLQNSIIQKSAGINEFMIRIAQENEGENVSSLVTQGLEKINDNVFEIRRTEKVGPKIGQELRRNTIYAIVFAILVIGVYISIRFQFRFAIGAVVALIHDVLFTLGIFSLAHLEISLSTIAAFLTIVGYSLNDTIVLYDRVREDMKSMRFDPIETIINKSINETLSRTIITSLTTFFVVFVLIFATGEVRVFAIAMMIGVVVGTYSSIYVAGPVVIAWQNKFNAKKK
ncbi:protein translocase subunit SecF [bacterium]|nr:protein translocase subunit SecF [bacterium]MBU1064988.1 protein translocase subunit SecF [bacterium]MBU1634988.1 protein translocase subunit SecF [bacterium]MBU1872756.1 protein translocase subunit SecF [bacterium]